MIDLKTECTTASSVRDVPVLGLVIERYELFGCAQLLEIFAQQINFLKCARGLLVVYSGLDCVVLVMLSRFIVI